MKSPSASYYGNQKTTNNKVNPKFQIPRSCKFFSDSLSTLCFDCMNRSISIKDGELWVLDEAVICTHSENSDKRLI